MTVRVGVDIGGTGINSAPVDLEYGVLVGDRQSVATPGVDSRRGDHHRGELVEDVGTDGPVGLGFPGVVKHGVTATTANLHPDWIGTNAEMLFAHHLGGRQVAVISDRRKGV